MAFNIGARCNTPDGEGVIVAKEFFGKDYRLGIKHDVFPANRQQGFYTNEVLYYFRHEVRLTIADISDQLNVLTNTARERMAACSPDLVGAMGGADIDFMTPEERADRHELLQMLPSQAEERAAASERIQQRIAQRKTRRLRAA